MTIIDLCYVGFCFGATLIDPPPGCTIGKVPQDRITQLIVSTAIAAWSKQIPSWWQRNLTGAVNYELIRYSDHDQRQSLFNNCSKSTERSFPLIKTFYRSCRRRRRQLILTTPMTHCDRGWHVVVIVCHGMEFPKQQLHTPEWQFTDGYYDIVNDRWLE